jgi:hypothetical protein
MALSKWDFWGSKKMSYDQRAKLGSGDNYGIGEPAKVGKARSYHMDESHPKGKPPRTRSPRKVG